MEKQNEDSMETVVSPVTGIQSLSDQPLAVVFVDCAMQHIAPCVIARAALNIRSSINNEEDN